MDCLRQFPENAKQAAGYQLQEKPENRGRRFGIGGKTLQQIDSGKEIMESQTFASVFDALCDTPAQAANMRLRAGLMMHIADTVRENGWTQKQAAMFCGLTRPRINDLLNGKIDKFSLDALVNINAGLGQCISLSFAPA